MFLKTYLCQIQDLLHLTLGIKSKFSLQLKVKSCGYLHKGAFIILVFKFSNSAPTCLCLLFFFHNNVWYSLLCHVLFLCQSEKSVMTFMVFKKIAPSHVTITTHLIRVSDSIKEK